MHRFSSSSSFTLLFALIIITTALTASVATFNILLKEVQLARFGSESMRAMYAAESAAECVLYWTTKGSDFAAGDPKGAVCGNTTIPAQNTFTVTYGTLSGSSARVAVTKDGTSGETIIQSNGSNIQGVNKVRVERGVEYSLGYSAPVVTPPSGSVCGNNIIETGEVCDGTDLGGATCVSEDPTTYGGGTLSCSASCTLNFSQCTLNPPSGPPWVLTVQTSGTGRVLNNSPARPPTLISCGTGSSNDCTESFAAGTRVVITVSSGGVPVWGGCSSVSANGYNCTIDAMTSHKTLTVAF